MPKLILKCVQVWSKKNIESAILARKKISREKNIWDIYCFYFILSWLKRKIFMVILNFGPSLIFYWTVSDWNILRRCFPQLLSFYGWMLPLVQTILINYKIKSKLKAYQSICQCFCLLRIFCDLVLFPNPQHQQRYDNCKFTLNSKVSDGHIPKKFWIHKINNVGINNKSLSSESFQIRAKVFPSQTAFSFS